MSTFRAILVLFLAAFLIPTTGCNLVSRYELARAAKLESQGEFQRASNVYLKILARLPEQERRQRSTAFLHLGDCQLRLGNPSGAFAAYQKSSSADPKNMGAHLRLGEMYLAGGAAERASEQAQTILAVAAASPDALALLGAASSAAGDMQMAERAFERLLNAEPQRVQVAVALADIYDRQDETEKARQVLTKAAKAQPASSLPLLALGRLEEEAGNIAAAESAYRSAVGAEDTPETNKRLARFLARTSHPDEAIDVLAHADSLNPKSPVAKADFRLLSGHAMAALDGYSEALNSPALDRSRLEKWLRPNKTVSAKEEAQSPAETAVRIIEADIQIAAAAATSDPSIVPATGAARLHLAYYRNVLDVTTAQILAAEVSLIENNLTKAFDEAREAAESAGDSAPAHYVYGLVLYRRGDEPAARAEWVLALEQDSTYVPARLALSEDALRNGSNLQAEQYVVPVVRDEPENLRGLKIFSLSLLGQGRYASAELIANRALKLNANDSEVHTLKGKIAAAQNHLATALAEYEKGISLEPRSQNAIEGLYDLYSHQQISIEMLQKLEHMAEMPPVSAPLLEMAARLYAREGHIEDAERCLRSSLKIDPYRVTAIATLAAFKANGREEEAALDLGARIGGPNAALFRALRAQGRNDRTEAAAEYESAIRQGENSGVAANNLAWMLAENDSDLDRALTMAQRAWSLAPSDPAVMDTLGFVYLRRREFTAAIPVLTEAVQLAERYPEKADQKSIKRHLDEAYFKAGQTR